MGQMPLDMFTVIASMLAAGKVKYIAQELENSLIPVLREDAIDKLDRERSGQIIWSKNAKRSLSRSSLGTK